MNDRFPFKTLLICCLIGAIVWGCVISALGQPTEKHWYGWTKKDLNRLGAWSLCAVGGVAWGTHEAIYADPRVLEKRFGFSPTSWGGSRAWESKYPGGDYQEGEKPVWFRDKTNVFREAKKTTGFVGRYFPITAGIILTAQKDRKLTDYLIGAIVYSGSATITYNILR